MKIGKEREIKIYGMKSKNKKKDKEKKMKMTKKKV